MIMEMGMLLEEAFDKSGKMNREKYSDFCRVAGEYKGLEVLEKNLTGIAVLSRNMRVYDAAAFETDISRILEESPTCKTRYEELKEARINLKKAHESGDAKAIAEARKNLTITEVGFFGDYSSKAENDLELITDTINNQYEKDGTDGAKQLGEDLRDISDEMFDVLLSHYARATKKLYMFNKEMAEFEKVMGKPKDKEMSAVKSQVKGKENTAVKSQVKGKKK